ncbi:WD repeat-containing protein DWA2 isoform X1 [Vigna unguiculata]|uniref:WD repeat-containing protein DWA2 isoform X1 n=1 Tax=Vigna unguiculata TaxID=3917 RepID=UPI001016D022|nr:WD repeat-containing protein DWA2 isoform X1 [Vigna unguiculata]
MQAASTGIGYGLKYQARCISDVKADTDHTSFLAGTLSLKEENEVHLIRLSSSGTELFCEGLFSHPNEIWDLVSCPFDQRIFSTVYSNGETCGAAIWQIPELYGELNSPQLEKITSLDTDSGKIKCILWWPSGRHDKLISINEENMYLWNLDVSKKTAQIFFGDFELVPPRPSNTFKHNTRYNHKIQLVCCTNYLEGRGILMMKTISVECSHACSVDYHPQKQHILVTAEHESGIHIWDLRKPKLPIQELPGHTHWTWTVKCNPEYDGMILSSGTDSTVNLWLTSTNHDELTTERLVDSSARWVDPLLNSYSDYEDSIYGLTWSSREPWIFASLSYDGRVVVESVKPYIPKK